MSRGAAIESSAAPRLFQTANGVTTAYGCGYTLSPLTRLGGSLSQKQQIGTSRVATAAIVATAEKPAASNAGAEMVAMAAIPTCEAAFLTAMYSPRISVPTI